MKGYSFLLRYYPYTHPLPLIKKGDIKMRKKTILIMGILAIFISCYNVLGGESVKLNLAGFFLGIALVIRYFALRKSDNAIR